MAMVLLYTIL